MKRRFPVLLFLALLMLSSFIIEPQKKKILFLGDSITQAGAEPGGYIELMKEDLKKKGLDAKYQLVGAGVGGNKVRDVLKRLESDVIDQKPDVVFIMIGINDVGFFKWQVAEGGTPPDQYELGLKYIVKRIQQKGAAVILCSQTVIEEKPDGTNSLDKELDAYSAIVRKVAGETESQFCDMRGAFINYLIENNKEKKGKDVLTVDYVHMNEKGNRLIADTMIKFLK